MSRKAQNRPNQAFDEELCHKMNRKPQETVIAYDVDGMRALRVPARNPIDTPGIFPKSEFDRLKAQARIVTFKDRMTMLDEAAAKKNQLTQESEARKSRLRATKGKQKKVDPGLNTVEREAKSKNLYLLERSFNLIQEQDNRVKVANRMILATKCRAIRNAQIAEKELIAKQLQEEDRRLDLMMEQQRQKAMQEQEKRDQEEELKKQNYTDALADQMRTNEIARMIEAERIEEESRMVNEAFLALQREEEQKTIEKKVQQEQMRSDLRRANTELERYKLIQKEEERIADLRVQEFMRQKLERELAREQELALVKAAKEQEILRMRTQQQQSLDLRAAVDEMNALRIQEDVERKFRENELKAAKAKKEQQDNLMKEREQQIEHLKQVAAITLARDEEDFYRVVTCQKAKLEKEMEAQKKKQAEAKAHRQHLLRQINEKESERILMQRDKYEEGNLMGYEQKRKDLHVHEHLKKKVKDLRQQQMPEEYVKDIEHHIETIVSKY